MTSSNPSTISPQVSEAVGKLCVGGDWACAHGDVSGLRHVAQQLAAYTPEPLHCSLHELVAICDAQPERAAELWARLKNLIYRGRT